MQSELRKVARRPVGLLILCLAGCAVSVLGCKSQAPLLDDAAVNTAVQNRLQSDPGLTGEAVQATVQGGTATLSGKVSSEAARSLAANDVAEVAGVRTVINDLELQSSTAKTQNVPAPSRSAERPAEPYRANSAPVERREPTRIDPQPVREPTRVDPQPIPQPARALPPPAPAAPAFRNVTVPEGTGLPVRITETLDSASTQPGSTFSGVLASDVIVDGLVAFPTGTRVTGHVDDVKDAGHFKGNSLLSVSLSGISRRGENVTITTDSFSKEGKGRGKNTAEKVGGGAAVGAILGGILGGGKGAAIGAGAGGAVGAGANGVTRGEQVQIPSESLIRFRLSSAVTVRAPAQADGDNGGNLRRHDQ